MAHCRDLVADEELNEEAAYLEIINESCENLIVDTRHEPRFVPGSTV